MFSSVAAGARGTLWTTRTSTHSTQFNCSRRNGFAFSPLKKKTHRLLDAALRRPAGHEEVVRRAQGQTRLDRRAHGGRGRGGGRGSVDGGLQASVGVAFVARFFGARHLHQALERARLQDHLFFGDLDALVIVCCYLLGDEDGTQRGGGGRRRRGRGRGSNGALIDRGGGGDTGRGEEDESRGGRSDERDGEASSSARPPPLLLVLLRHGYETRAGEELKGKKEQQAFVLSCVDRRKKEKTKKPKNHSLNALDDEDSRGGAFSSSRRTLVGIFPVSSALSRASSLSFVAALPCLASQNRSPAAVSRASRRLLLSFLLLLFVVLVVLLHPVE